MLEVIGHGSYGEVWLARNVMGAPRAVKVVRRADFESAEPFERELDAVRRYERASRHSQGLVDVLHVGRSPDDQFFFYVMELADQVAGVANYQPQTLRRRLTGAGRLPVDDCLAIALTLVLGLETLHAAGLIHRDVKPSNIIFVRGQAMLADIGLLGEVGDGITLVGTEGFVPPEGSGQPSADLFALGMVLYECLTGEGHDHFPTVPKEWLSAGGEWTSEFEFLEVVLKACESDVARRYQSAAEMLSDVTILRSGKSVRQLHRLEARQGLFRRLWPRGRKI